MVVVIPNYVKFGNTYYTKCLLTFSCKSIKLEGSPPWQTKEPCCHEWPISNIVNIEHEFCETVSMANFPEFRLTQWIFIPNFKFRDCRLKWLL